MQARCQPNSWSDFASSNSTTRRLPNLLVWEKWFWIKNNFGIFSILAAIVVCFSKISFCFVNNCQVWSKNWKTVARVRSTCLIPFPMITCWTCSTMPVQTIASSWPNLASRSGICAFLPRRVRIILWLAARMLVPRRCGMTRPEFWLIRTETLALQCPTLDLPHWSILSAAAKERSCKIFIFWVNYWRWFLVC